MVEQLLAAGAAVDAETKVRATPESKKGSSKFHFPFKAVAFKSGERGYPRF